MNLDRQIGWVGVVEKDVPLPATKRPKSILKPIMRRMKVGDSFETTISNTAVHRTAKLLEIVCETRVIEGKKIRVWRVA